jgi:carbon storage regulator CsrA
MTNLVLTRKAGQSVRLMINGVAEYVDILDVCGGFCKMRILSTLQVERVRFRDSLQIADGVSVLVVDLAKGHAKLNFTAPREVQILRTELIKETE